MSTLETPFRPSDIPLGLVGYWKFNNDATDSSGNGYDLTPQNTPTYTANGSYWKDTYCGNTVEASNQLWSYTDPTNLHFTASCSIAFWMKHSTDTGGEIFICRAGGDKGYQIKIEATKKITFEVNYATDYESADNAIVTGKWQHFCYTFDYGTTNECNLYIDGNLAKSSTTTAAITSVAANLVISNAMGASFFDMAAWSVVLTPLQVKSLALGVDLSKYAYRPNNVSTQPTHWWKLNEVSGNRADSVSTNPLTLTDNNTVLSSGGYVEGVGALFVPANSESLSASDSADWDFGTGDFSFSLWMRLTATPNGTTKYIISRKSGGDVNYCIYYDGTNLVTRIANANVNIPTVSMVSGGTYHIAWKRTSGECGVYVDGIQLGANVTKTTDIQEAETLTIGAYQGGVQGIPAVITDVSVWKGYALTDAEIKSLACALPIQRKGIVSYWKGADVNDSIGTATLTNAGGVTFGAGLFANGMICDGGATGYLSSGDDSLAVTGDMTALTWIKTAGVGADCGFMGIDVAGNGYGFLKGGSGETNWYGSGSVGTAKSAAPTANVFTHMVGVTSGAGYQQFTNGVATGVETAGTDYPQTSAAETFYLGWAGSTLGKVACTLSETIIAKRYFRPEEIKAVYLKGLNGKEVTSSESGGSSSNSLGQFFALL